MKKISIINLILTLLTSLLFFVYKTQGYYSAINLTNPLILLVTFGAVCASLSILSIYIYVKEFLNTKKVITKIQLSIALVVSIGLTIIICISNIMYIDMGWYSIVCCIIVATAITAISFWWKAILNVIELKAINKKKDQNHPHSKLSK